MTELPRDTAEKIARLLVERLEGLSREDAVRLLAFVLLATTPGEIVAITQCMPPHIRELMPRKHLH